MKKLFYIVLLVVVLLVVAHFVKNNRTPGEINGVNVNEVVTITTDDEGSIISEEDVILINDGTEEAPVDSIEEDIVEENPDLTADDGETIIEE